MSDSHLVQTSTFRLFRLYHKYLKVETLKRCADIRLVHEIDEERRHFSAFPKELGPITYQSTISLPMPVSYWSEG